MISPSISAASLAAKAVLPAAVCPRMHIRFMEFFLLTDELHGFCIYETVKIIFNFDKTDPMNVKKLYQRSRSLMFQPFTAWPEISSEKMIRSQVVLEFLLPMSILVGICSFLGTFFNEGIEDSFSVGYLLLSGFISFIMIFLEVYL